MRLKRVHLPPVGIVGLLASGFLRTVSFIFHWPIGVVIFSEIVLLISIVWIGLFDLMPLMFPVFGTIRDMYYRRYTTFVALFSLFIISQAIVYFLPSGPVKDVTTTLAFLAFSGTILWALVVLTAMNFPPLWRYLRRRLPEPERVTFSDVVTSMAIIITPSIILSFFFAPTGLSAAIVTPFQIFTSAILTDAFIAAYLYLYIIKPKVFSWRQLGLRKVDRADFGHALVLFIVIAVIVAIIEAFLNRLGLPLQQYSFSTKDGAYLAVLAVVGITPFVEELYFRGFLFRGLLLHHRPWIAYVISAGLFAILHPPLLVMAEVFIIGLLLAYLIKETKSIWPGVLIHALNNTIVFGYLLYR